MTGSNKRDLRKCPLCGKSVELVSAQGKPVYQLCPSCYGFVVVTGKDTYRWREAVKFMPSYMK